LAVALAPGGDVELLEGVGEVRLDVALGDVEPVLSSGTTSTSCLGVNLGPSLGNATLHSGTLAAAKQATLLGLRGIALSLTPLRLDLTDHDELERVAGATVAGEV